MRTRKALEWLAPRLPVILVVVITAGVLGIIMALSYAAEVELAVRNGKAPWQANLIPFAVDGMLVVATIALYWAGQRGIRRPVPPLVLAAVGMAATIGANFVSEDRGRWLGPAVAGSVGVAAVLVTWVAHWMIETHRKLAAGEDLRPAAGCSCPPWPITLDEAVPGARAERIRRGEPAGQQAIADGYETTRYRVQLILAPPDGVAPPAGVALTNGNGHGPAG